MKKVLIIILSIAMLLTMVACGKERDSEITYEEEWYEESYDEYYGYGEEEYQEEIIIQEPTDEEWEELCRFSKIITLFSETDRPDYVDKEGVYFDTCGVAAYYDEVKAMENVDKWFGTDYAPETSRQEFLDRFVIIEDVLLAEIREYRDFLGNKIETGMDETGEWHYDAEGRVVSADNYFDYADIIHSFTEQIRSDPLRAGYESDCLYSYNEDGTLEKIEYYGGNKIEMLRTFSYENGTLVGEKAVRADGYAGEVTYHYNEQGQLVQIECTGSLVNNETRTFIYTYDDHGRVISEYLESYGYPVEATLMTYTYSIDGKLNSAKLERKNLDTGLYKDYAELFYEHDEQGRLATVNMRYIDTPGFAECVTTLEYGDYYIYNAAEG